MYIIYGSSSCTEIWLDDVRAPYKSYLFMNFLKYKMQPAAIKFGRWRIAQFEPSQGLKI